MICSAVFFVLPRLFTEIPPLVKGPDHHISLKQCEQLNSSEAWAGCWVLPLPFWVVERGYTINESMYIMVDELVHILCTYNHAYIHFRYIYVHDIYRMKRWYVKVVKYSEEEWSCFLGGSRIFWFIACKLKPTASCDMYDYIVFYILFIKENRLKCMPELVVSSQS